MAARTRQRKSEEEPVSLGVRIIGRGAPGRSCAGMSDVSVGFVEDKKSHPAEFTPADFDEQTWETTIEVKDDGDFRGPAVNGPKGERFFYLTWIGREPGAKPRMFRRAKLRLDRIPADVLAAALKSRKLTCEVWLTLPDGTPTCASVKPPLISWTAS